MCVCRSTVPVLMSMCWNVCVSLRPAGLCPLDCIVLIEQSEGCSPDLTGAGAPSLVSHQLANFLQTTRQKRNRTDTLMYQYGAIFKEYIHQINKFACCSLF